MPDQDYSHIKDGDTVLFKHPETGRVGSSTGLAFRQVYGPQGYVQIGVDEYEDGLNVYREEQGDFASSGTVIATLPDGEPDAQDVINRERGVGRTDGPVATGQEG